MTVKCGKKGGHQQENPNNTQRNHAVQHRKDRNPKCTTLYCYLQVYTWFVYIIYSLLLHSILCNACYDYLQLQQPNLVEHTTSCTNHFSASVAAGIGVCLPQVSNPASGYRGEASQRCRAAWGPLQSARAACTLLRCGHGSSRAQHTLVHRPSFSLSQAVRVWQHCRWTCLSQASREPACFPPCSGSLPLLSQACSDSMNGENEGNGQHDNKLYHIASWTTLLLVKYFTLTIYITSHTS